MSSLVPSSPVLSDWPGDMLSARMQDAVAVDLALVPAGTRLGGGDPSEGDATDDSQVPDVATLDSMVDAANLILGRLAAVDFYLDEDRDGIAVYVHDGDAGQSIRRIPSEVLPELSKKIQGLSRFLSDAGVINSRFVDAHDVGLN